MSRADTVLDEFRSSSVPRLQRPGSVYRHLIRHTLESFLDRLSCTAHADDFLLKVGRGIAILLSAAM